MFVALFASGCVATSDGRTCMSDRRLTYALQRLERMADAAAQAKDLPLTETQLIESSCRERVFARSGYRIRVYLSRRYGVAELSGSIMPSSTDDRMPRGPECLAAGEAEAAALSPVFRAVIAENRRLDESSWDDIDGGPVNWLHCAERPSRDWYNGIATFIHELNHGNRTRVAGKGNRQSGCLYFAPEQRRLCFVFSSRLPTRGLARLSSFPAMEKETLNFYEFSQSAYLDHAETSYLMLLDELNSYILSTQVRTQVLTQHGFAALSNVSHPQVELLPLFMLYAVRYLDRLRQDAPRLYRANFGDESANRRNLKILLDEGARTHAAWVAALSAVNKSPGAGELAVFDAHRRARSAILP